MKPYRLFIRFYSPPVYYHRPTLDSLISFCLTMSLPRENLGSFCKPKTIVKLTNFTELRNIILEYRIEPYYLLVFSYLISVNESQYLDSWKKRWDSDYAHIADFGKSRRRIDTASGEFRSFSTPIPVHVMDMAYFDFIGDGERVVRMIEERIVGIGKKVSEGWGWIDSLELIEMPKATFIGILSERPVPLQAANYLGIHGSVQQASWKSPYWLRDNICECVVPT